MSKKASQLNYLATAADDDFLYVVDDSEAVTSSDRQKRVKLSVLKTYFSSTPTFTGPVTIGTLVLDSASITDTSGTISLGDENVTSTGTGSFGGITVASDLTLASGSITSASGAISFGNENLSTTGTATFGFTTLNEALAFASNGTSSSGRILKTAASGLTMRGVTGTTYDLSLQSATGVNVLGVTTGTANIVFGGNLSTTGTLASGAATVTGNLTTTGQVLTASTVSGGIVFGGTTASGHIYRDAATGDLQIVPQSAKNLDVTGNVVTSGNFILGTTSTSSNAQFYATKTYSGAVTVNAAYFKYTQDTASGSALLRGLYGEVVASHTTGTVGEIRGTTGYAQTTGSGGTTSFVTGMQAAVAIGAGSTATVARSLYIPNKTRSGSIGTDWAIQSEDTAASHLAGSLRIGTTSAAGNEILRVNGLIHSDSDSIIIDTAKTPASAGATGTQGQVAWDSDYVYVCVATNTWKRAAIATW